jgi:hypothetical protein
MATITGSTVCALFNSREQAERAVSELQRDGFLRDRIGVVARDPDGTSRVRSVEKGNHAGEGAIGGLAAGAGVGALVSLGMTFGMIPVIGPVLAVGPLAAALLSAAGGAAAGGLTGALIGWGIPEEEAQYYEQEVSSGRYLVTVDGEGRQNEAEKILRRCGGDNREWGREIV